MAMLRIRSGEVAERKVVRAPRIWRVPEVRRRRRSIERGERPRGGGVGSREGDVEEVGEEGDGEERRVVSRGMMRV